jgi:hypothetical protein
MTTLFDPLQMGEIALSNRIAMAPLTRNRAPGGVPCERMVTYYRQRASAGLDHHRGQPDRPAGPRLPGHAGHLHRRAGGGLAARHRRRARQGRAHRGAAVACGPHLAHQPAARWRGAGVVHRPRGAVAHLHRRGLRAHVHPARAALGGSAAGGGTVPPRGPVRPASRLRRRGSAWCQRLPDRAVPARQHQRPNRRLGRVDRESGAPAAGRDGRPSAARSAAAARGCG